MGGEGRGFTEYLRRPSHYEKELLGCRVAFDFPICKLLDLVARLDELERSQNPAALLVLAKKYRALPQQVEED